MRVSDASLIQSLTLLQSHTEQWAIMPDLYFYRDLDADTKAVAVRRLYVCIEGQDLMLAQGKEGTEAAEGAEEAPAAAAAPAPAEDWNAAPADWAGTSWEAGAN